jgi:predicted nucleotidyltransferase
MRDEKDFAARVARRIAGIPRVAAVTLGGSRATGIHRPDSDWDFALYYRGDLNPDDVRALGWPGQVFAPGDCRQCLGNETGARYAAT